MCMFKDQQQLQEKIITTPAVSIVLGLKSCWKVLELLEKFFRHNNYVQRNIHFVYKVLHHIYFNKWLSVIKQAGGSHEILRYRTRLTKVVCYRFFPEKKCK